MEQLQSAWATLHCNTLPALAQSRSSVQRNWPVTQAASFARVILDCAIGLDKPWTDVIAAPAATHMSEAQLQAVIDLGERVAAGREDLAQLEKRSRRLRGRGKRKSVELGDKGVAEPPVAKKSRKEEMADLWSRFSAAAAAPPTASVAKVQSTRTELPTPSDSEKAASSHGSPPRQAKKQTIQDDEAALASIRQVIAGDKTLTPFHRLTLTLLTQVPRGRYSTYQAMADHISKSSHKTCARAIGNAMRNNPYAPTAPCHRVLATGGKLGGFKGGWGAEGRFAEEKRRLLREEGVRFDGKGVAVGTPFKEFR